MRLTAMGHLTMLLSVSLLVAGLALSSVPVLVLASLVLMYLAVDGAYCRRSATLIKTFVNVKTDQSKVRITSGQPFTMTMAIANKSGLRLRIVKLRLRLPLELEEKQDSPVQNDMVLNPGAQVRSRIRMVAKQAGRFEVNLVKIEFEIPQRVFKHVMDFDINTVIMAYAQHTTLVAPLETGVLGDLTSDPLRRGPGTDLAGLRPTGRMDDFHLIDWKATARTGRLISKEYYLESETPIILMIDCSSSMKSDGSGRSMLKATIDNIDQVVSNIRHSNPLGLILFSETRIITMLAPERGVENRDKIRRNLVENIPLGGVDNEDTIEGISGHQISGREIRSMIEGLKLSSENRPYKNKISSFAQTLLPFYVHAEKNHSAKLRKLGVFHAFDAVCRLPQHTLVIVITDGRTNLNAYYEAIGRAAELGHRIVMAILADSKTPFETSPERGLPGAITLRCRPSEFASSVTFALLQLSRARSIPIRK